jgi:hypothetical protein
MYPSSRPEVSRSSTVARWHSRWLSRWTARRRRKSREVGM